MRFHPIRLTPRLSDWLRDKLDGDMSREAREIAAMLPLPYSEFPSKEQVKLIGKWFSSNPRIMTAIVPMRRRDVEEWASKFLDGRNAAHVIALAEEAHADDTSESASQVVSAASHYSLLIWAKDMLPKASPSDHEADALSEAKDMRHDGRFIFPADRSKRR